MPTRRIPAATGFLAVIAFILVIGLLKLGQTLFLPAMIALFLALALMPVMEFLRRWRFPVVLAALTSLSMAYVVLGTVLFLLSYSLRTMTLKAPLYTMKARVLLQWVAEQAQGYGLKADWSLFLSGLDPNIVAGMVGNSLLYLMNLFKYGLLVFFISLFLLMEATRFKDKFARAFGEHNLLEHSLRQIGDELQRYLFLKTLISLGTGVLVWAFLKTMGVDFPLVWGFLAFALNFIPSIGSIIASVPPLLITLVQFDSPLKYAVAVLLGLMAIQVSIGNFLDPRIMGETLKLSTLVIFLSLVFWGWIWGPAGMLLAVPLIVCIKVVLRHLPATRKWAILLEG